MAGQDKIHEDEMLVLFKVEDTFDVFNPPGVNDWIPAFNVSGLNQDGTELESEAACGALGAKPKILVNKHFPPKFSFYLTGSGAAGTPPAWGGVMRACGYREDIFVGDRVEYSPISKDYESASMVGYVGDNKHPGKGLRGNISFSVSPSNYLVASVELMGTHIAASDDAGHAIPDCNSGTSALPIGPEHTTLSAFGLTDLDIYSLNIDSGRSPAYEEYISSRSTEIDNREMSGDIEFAAVPLTIKDWDQAFGETGVIDLVHGKTAGQIVQILLPKAAVGKHEYGAQNGYKSSKIPLNILPATVDDDIKIVVR